VWNAAQDLGAGVPGGVVLLRTRAADFTLTGAWSAPLPYTVSLPSDPDGDGLPSAWEVSHGLDPNVASALTDGDRDGVVDLMEYALGMNPQAGATVGLPVATVEGGYLTLTVSRNAEAAASLLFNVQVSGDLQSWLSGAAHVTILQDTPTLLKVRDNVQASAMARRHLRLQVVAP
jgi:hypothetical protein